jgi:hypothetical protein
MRSRILALATGIMAVCLLSGAPARADTLWDFTFTADLGQSSPSYSINGQLDTTGSDLGGGYFQVSSISGSIISPNLASTTIGSLYTGSGAFAVPPAFNTDPLFYTYDNVINPTTSPYFTSTGGVYFSSTNGAMWLFYAVGPVVWLSTTDQGYCGPFCNPGVSGTFQIAEVSQTPLPSAWLMLLSSFVGLGFLAYCGTKKNIVAIAAA